MAETIGLLVLQAAGVTTIAGFGNLTVFGISLAQVVGTAVLAGTLLGLQYVLAPNAPKPADGQVTTRQPIPPRIFGYGRARIGGYYMLFETSVDGKFSDDVIAFCEGPVAGFKHYYLHEEEVLIAASGDDGVGPGAKGVVASVPQFTFGDDQRYLGGNVTIKTRVGLSTETTYSHLLSGEAALPAGIWTADHRGDGIASAALTCFATKAEDFQKYFPHLKPELTVVIDFPEIWDPRDENQDPDDRSTWSDYPAYDEETTYADGDRVVYLGAVYRSRQDSNTGNTPDEEPRYWTRGAANPVLQVIDYLTDQSRGMGLDRAMLVDPVLDDLMAEADLCDELVLRKAGTYEPRYSSNGWGTFDTDPQQILSNILATCDGWMEVGSGVLNLKVGLYRAPTVTLKAQHIVELSCATGVGDEQAVNELTISFTSPSHKYKEVAGQSWRDEVDITERGRTRSQALPLTWTQTHSQARRLAKRQMARLSAPRRGQGVATLYGLSLLGERWVRLQYPLIAGLEDIVVEIQNVKVNLPGRMVTFDWVIVNPNAIDAWDPAAEEGKEPPNPDDVGSEGLPVPANVEGTAVGAPPFHIDLSWDDLNRSDLTYVIRYRVTDDGTGNPGAWAEVYASSPTEDDDRLLTTIYPPSADDYDVEIASVGSKGSRSGWSETITVTLASAAMDFSRVTNSGYVALLEDV